MGVWGTLLLVDTAAVKSSFVIANVLITRLGRYTAVGMEGFRDGPLFSKVRTRTQIRKAEKALGYSSLSP